MRLLLFYAWLMRSMGPRTFGIWLWMMLLTMGFILFLFLRA
jgi:hypothetical protein